MKPPTFLTHEVLALGIAALAMLFASGPANAQIYESIDATGVRHFTNLVRSLPEAARGGARVFVDAAPSPKPDDGRSLAAQEMPAEDVSRQGQAEEVAVAEAYQAGWSGGFGAGQQAVIVPPLRVVVVPSPAPVVAAAAPYDPAGLYYQSPYAGTLTRPFDGGRSRGLTLRRQLEERFQRW
jgi:hypothetical protein